MQDGVSSSSFSLFMGSASAFVNLSCQFGETSFQVCLVAPTIGEGPHILLDSLNPFWIFLVTLSLLWTETGTKRFSCIVINHYKRKYEISDARPRHDNSLYSWESMVLPVEISWVRSGKQIDVKLSNVNITRLTLLT